VTTTTKTHFTLDDDDIGYNDTTRRRNVSLLQKEEGNRTHNATTAQFNSDSQQNKETEALLLTVPTSTSTS